MTKRILPANRVYRFIGRFLPDTLMMNDAASLSPCPHPILGLEKCNDYKGRYHFLTLRNSLDLIFYPGNTTSQAHIKGIKNIYKGNYKSCLLPLYNPSSHLHSNSHSVIKYIDLCVYHLYIKFVLFGGSLGIW